MATSTIERITCHAALDPDRPAVVDAHARAADGDDDMRRWLDDLENGTACLVSISLVAVLLQNGQEVEACTMNGGIWMEVPAHPAVAAKQIQESAAQAFPELTTLLLDKGASVAIADLDNMLVGVELDDSLTRIIHEYGQRV